MDDDPIDLTALDGTSGWSDAIDRLAARAAQHHAQRTSVLGQIRSFAAPAVVLAVAAAAVLWLIQARPQSRPANALSYQLLDWSTRPELPSVSEALAALEVRP